MSTARHPGSFWSRTLGNVRRLVAPWVSSAGRPQRRRLASLLELEDRRLLSATPIGSVFQVNTHTQGPQQTFQQTPQAVAVNPTTGDFVVVWSSQGQNTGGGWDVYFQRYNAAGVTQGSETLVDAHVQGANQEYANVAMNASGNFVVTWSGNQLGHFNIYAQQYNASGQAQGSAIPVDTPGNNDQLYSTIAMDAAGNFVVTWIGQPTGGAWSVYGREYNYTGMPMTSAFQVSNVNSTPLNDAGHAGADVAMNANGNFVITWAGQQGPNQNVYGQLYAAGSTPVGSVFQVNATSLNQQDQPAVAMDANGDFVVTWSGQVPGPYNWDVYAQRYNSSGSPMGSAIQVASSVNDNSDPSVAMDGSGNFVVTWSGQPQGGHYQIYRQQYLANGQQDGNQFLIDNYTTNDQSFPSVAMTTNGQYVVVWSSNGQDGDNWGVFGQRYVDSGTPGIIVTGSTFLVAEDGNVLRIDALTGAVVATYTTNVANDGLAVGPDGSLYVADFSTNTILHYDPAGNFIASFSTTGTPQGLAFGPNGNLYVTTTSSTVEEYSPAGTSLGTFISAGSGGLDNAKAIVWGPDGNAYVSSFFNSEVLRYNGTTGAFMNVFATGSGGFEDLTFGPNNNLYVASYFDGAIYEYDGTSGVSLGTFASGITAPYSLRFDPQGNLDVSSRSTGQILVYEGTTGVLRGATDSGLTNPAYMTATSSLVTSQSGTSAKFSISLASAPIAPVTINLATSVSGQGSLSLTSLTFNTTNWNVPQTVSVTGLNDNIVNGDQTYQITGTASSSDPNYSGMAMAPVVVTNVQTDVAGINVTTRSIQTSMSGGSASFNVSLTSAPVATVTLNLSSNDPSEGILSQSVLTFDASNWNVPQVVTVTGENDTGALGNVIYQIDGTATSSDSNYDNVAMTPVNVTNVNTTLPGFIVTPTWLTTSQAGTSASFSVALTVAPAFDVTLNFTIGNPQEGSLSTSSLTFMTGPGWNAPQTVTVTGLNDNIAEGSVTYQISGQATSLDPLYDLVSMTPVTVVNQSTDVPGFTVTPTVLTTSESGTSASFTVALTSQPLSQVSLYLWSSNPSQGSLSQMTLVFDSGDWNNAQTVTVTGLDSYMTTPSQTYEITGTSWSWDGNYYDFKISPVTVINTESPNSSSTALVSSTGSSAYGQSVTFTATVTGVAPMSGTPTGTITFMDGSADLATVPLTGGSAVFTTSLLNVGTHQVTVQYSADSYFDASSSSVLPQTVAPATLTVAAGDVSRIYGQPNPTFTDTITGFVNGDPGSVVSGTASLTTAATTTSAPGNYVITAGLGNLGAANYAFQFANGTLTVTALPTVSPPTGGTGGTGNGSGANSLTTTEIRTAIVALETAASSSSAAAASSGAAAGESRGTAASSSPSSRAAVAALLQTSHTVIPASDGTVDTGTGQLVTGVSGRPAQILVLLPHISSPKTGVGRTVAASPADNDSTSTALTSSLLALGGSRSQHGTFESDGLDVLSDAGERMPWTPEAQESTAFITSGIVASTGYVLLNTRLGAWVLSLLTSQPLWKELDPLDVLYAWEDEMHKDGTKDRETLVSLVD